MSMLTILVAATLQAQAAVPVVEYRMDRTRRDGDNHWSLGPWSGTFGGLARRGSLIPGRDYNFSRASYTAHGPGFEDGEIGVRCEGRESAFAIGWIEFDRDELVYGCDFYRDGAPIDSQFELVFTRRGGFLSRLARAGRAGEIRYEGVTVRFETMEMGAGALMGQNVRGYVLRDAAGAEIGTMEYGMMAPTLVLPGDGSPDQEAALLAALALAFFMDPANDQG